MSDETSPRAAVVLASIEQQDAVREIGHKLIGAFVDVCEGKSTGLCYTALIRTTAAVAKAHGFSLEQSMTLFVHHFEAMSEEAVSRQINAPAPKGAAS